MPNRTTVAARHNGIAKTYFLISENSQSVPKCMYTFRNMKADVTNLGHYVGNYYLAVAYCISANDITTCTVL